MTDDEQPVRRLRAAIADLQARADDLGPDRDDPEPDEASPAGPEGDDLEAIEARLAAREAPTPVEESPIRAGLETLLDLRDAGETSATPEPSLEAAEATVVDLQDEIRTLADLYGQYSRDTARPEIGGSPVDPMTTPAEPEAEAKEPEAEPLPPHALTKRRLARLAVVLVASAVLSPVLTGVAPVGFYAVATGSMAPEIPQGSLVWTETADPAVGDVIVYESHLGKPTVHRVTDVRTVDGTTYYRTQGDANPSPDAYAVPKDRVQGIVDGSLPLVGNLWMVDLQIQAIAFGGLVGAYVAMTAAFDERVIAKLRRDEAPKTPETPEPAAA